MKNDKLLLDDELSLKGKSMALLNTQLYVDSFLRKNT
jgi:hypothetical protein